MLKRLAPNVISILIVLVICTATVQAKEKTTAQVLAKTSKSWNGNALERYPKGTPEVTILRIRIPAGTTLPWHTHPVINAGVLISGELTVTTKAG
ncbi:MAG: cupin domain-containing protein, partial [Desulfobacterales bacterium]|nr:cupin domain-containing protein [Desulfobacterales bacterium]